MLQQQAAYVMGFCALEAHRLYPGGVGRLTRDIQAEINETVGGSSGKSVPSRAATTMADQQAFSYQAAEHRL